MVPKPTAKPAPKAYVPTAVTKICFQAWPVRNPTNAVPFFAVTMNTRERTFQYVRVVATGPRQGMPLPARTGFGLLGFLDVCCLAPFRATEVGRLLHVLVRLYCDGTWDTHEWAEPSRRASCGEYSAIGVCVCGDCAQNNLDEKRRAECGGDVKDSITSDVADI